MSSNSQKKAQVLSLRSKQSAPTSGALLIALNFALQCDLSGFQGVCAIITHEAQKKTLKGTNSMNVFTMRMWTININGKHVAVLVPNRVSETDYVFVTYEQIIKLAGFKEGSTPSMLYSRGGDAKRPSGAPLPGGVIAIQDGTIFSVVFTGNA